MPRWFMLSVLHTCTIMHLIIVDRAGLASCRGPVIYFFHCLNWWRTWGSKTSSVDTFYQKQFEVIQEFLNTLFLRIPNKWKIIKISFAKRGKHGVIPGPVNVRTTVHVWTSRRTKTRKKNTKNLTLELRPDAPSPPSLPFNREVHTDKKSP